MHVWLGWGQKMPAWLGGGNEDERHMAPVYA